mmetsp:Transcript_34929/g.58697  ORF Transcript_34929/g.58697 Transcript_34929/m.58697 type:complete len:555 (+) Transcript_34929:164-1828(+)
MAGLFESLSPLEKKLTSASMSLLDDHARQLEKFRHAEEIKRRKMMMDEDRRRLIEAKQQRDNSKIGNKKELLAQKQMRLQEQDLVRTEKVHLQNEHDRRTADHREKIFDLKDRALKHKLAEEERHMREGITANEAVKTHNTRLANQRREAKVEDLRNRVIEKHKANEQAPDRKEMLMVQEQQRLQEADAARRLRVERAQMEEEMRQVTKLREIEEKDANLRRHMEEEERSLSHMKAIQAAEKAAALERLVWQRTELEEYKRQRIEAKIMADKQKIINKEDRISNEKGRLQLQDSIRSTTTMKAKQDEEERKVRLIRELEEKDAALKAQMMAEATELQRRQKEQDVINKVHQLRIETRRKDLENLKRARTEAKLEADNTKEENKKELLELEKQRLNIVNMVTSMKVEKANLEYAAKTNVKVKRMEEEDRRMTEIKALRSAEMKKSELFKVRMKLELESQTLKLQDMHLQRSKSELPMRMEAEARLRGGYVDYGEGAYTSPSSPTSPYASPSLNKQTSLQEPGVRPLRSVSSARPNRGIFRMTFDVLRGRKSPAEI